MTIGKQECPHCGAPVIPRAKVLVSAFTGRPVACGACAKLSSPPAWLGWFFLLYPFLALLDAYYLSRDSATGVYSLKIFLFTLLGAAGLGAALFLATPLRKRDAPPPPGN